MPTVALHHKSVGQLALPRKGRIRYWDDSLAGFHVLATPKERIYKVRFTRPNGTKIDYRIGKVADWAISTAREKADKVIKAANASEPGDDPQFKKLKARSKQETFGTLAANCMESLSLRPSTRKNWDGLVKNYIVPRFGTVDAASIDRKMIREFIERIAKEKPVQAARVFEVMRRIFSWAVETESLRGTPFANLKKPVRVQAADSLERDRCLSRAEIHRVFATLKDARFALGDFDQYIRLLFETAVRRDEMLKATWDEIDMDAGFFTIRTLRYKSKKPHQIPLTPAAICALETIRNQSNARSALEVIRVRIRSTKEGDDQDKLKVREEDLVKRIRAVEKSPFVFPGPDPKKARISPQRAFEELRRRVGFEDWVLHDIRRTTSRELGRLGTMPHVRESILGHSLDKLARTYGAEAPLLEMREALKKWSAQLDEIIKTAPSVHSFESKDNASLRTA